MSNSTDSRLGELIGLVGAKRVVAGLSRREIHTHAILLYGSEGCGKDTIANILCQSWLCSNLDPVHGADGACPACLAWLRNKSADVLFIAPSGPGNMITINQVAVRGAKTGEDVLCLEEFLRTPPLMSQHKVVIISSAERMSSATSNSLLKTLEEPPHFAKLILTTNSTAGVRSTILSRTLAVACSSPSDEELLKAFPDALPEDFLIAENAPERIQKILENPNPYREAVVFARNLPTRKRFEALVVAEHFRSLAERFDDCFKCGTRHATAEMIRILCVIFTRETGFPGHWGGRLVQAHERIIANGQASLVTDALFASLLDE